MPFNEDLDLDGGGVAHFTRAAHIIGSASVTAWTPTTSVVFSGDLGRHDHPVLKPRDTPPGAPYALIESTYGDREHPELGPLPHEEFADLMRRTFQRGDSVLIRAFAVDRTEALPKTLAELRRAGRIPMSPVYIDSPIANAALEVMLPDKRNSVVLIGYQAVGTRSRGLVEGVKKMKMHGHYIPVKAEIFQDREFSVHGDGSDLIDWLRDLGPQPQTVFCVHGEPETAEAFSMHIEAELPHIDAILPEHGEIVLLDGRHAAAQPRPAQARVIQRPVQDAAGSTPAPVTDPPRHVETVPVAKLALGKVCEYRLLHVASPAELERLVTAALGDGFSPYGDPGLGTVDGQAVFVQAVVK